jgi:hypothetical protein
MLDWYRHSTWWSILDFELKKKIKARDGRVPADAAINDIRVRAHSVVHHQLLCGIEEPLLPDILQPGAQPQILGDLKFRKAPVAQAAPGKG